MEYAALEGDQDMRSEEELARVFEIITRLEREIQRSRGHDLDEDENYQALLTVQYQEARAHTFSNKQPTEKTLVFAGQTQRRQEISATVKLVLGALTEATGRANRNEGMEGSEFMGGDFYAVFKSGFNPHPLYISPLQITNISWY